MIEKTVKCETITPLISRSLDFTMANNNDYKIYNFELRPQSVKGVLHFWFRAVAPRIIDVFKLNFDNVKSEERKKEIQKIYGEMEYKGLRYLESLIFGSQEQKAPFGLSVRYNTRDVIEIGEIQGSKFSVKSKEFEKSFLYALYGTYATAKERFVVRCLKSHANFELIFRVKNEDLWEVILSLLKLVSVLGGFGAKTTKGFGQFKIVRIEGENTSNFDRSKYTTKGEIQSLLKETEDILRKYIKKFDTDELLRLEKSSNIDFPNLLDESFEFFESTVTGREDWKKVMEELYKISQDAQRNGVYKKIKLKLRYYRQSDVVKVLIACLNGQSKEVNVFPALLGMPLQYQNLKSEVSKVTFYPYVRGEINDRGRKPSPLRIIINTGKAQRDRWAAYFLILKSKVTQDNSLKHDPEKSFSSKLTLTVDDLVNLLNNFKSEGGVSH